MFVSLSLSPVTFALFANFSWILTDGPDVFRVRFFSVKFLWKQVA